LGGNLDLSLDIYGDKIDKLWNNTEKTMSDLLTGAISSNDLKKVLDDLYSIFEQEGTLDLNGKIDLGIAQGYADGTLSYSNKNKARDVILSGVADLRAEALGFLEAKLHVGIKYNATIGKMDTWFTSSSSGANSMALVAPAALSATEYFNGAGSAITNLAPVASMRLGAATAPGGFMGLTAAAATIPFYSVDGAPRLISMNSDDSSAVITVTMPADASNFLNHYAPGEVYDEDGNLRYTVTVGVSGVKSVTLANGTVFTEGQASNTFLVTPAWRINEGGSYDGSYDGSFMIAGAGDWSFDSDSAISLNLFELTALPEMTSAIVSGGNVSWSYEANGADLTDYKAHLLLLDSTGSMIASLADYSDEDSLWLYPSLTDATAQLNLPTNVNSGEYMIMVQMLDADDNCVSIAQSELFNWINPEAPGQVQNISAEYSGNGSFEVSWNPVSGAAGYMVEILDDDGNTIRGIAAVDVVYGNSTVIYGGMVETVTFEPDPVSGEPVIESIAEVGLPFGEEYTISVKAYKATEFEKMLNGESQLSKSMLFGLTGTSSFNLPEPVIPELTVSVGNSKGDGQTAFTVNNLNPEVRITSDIEAEITVELIDGTKETNGTGTSHTWKEGFESDGAYALKVTATTISGDSKEMRVYILVDTYAPGLVILSGGLMGESGTFRLEGVTETGAELRYLMGIAEPGRTQVEGEIINTEDGEFNLELSTNRRLTQVTVAATDLAGNVTEQIVEAVMADAGRLVAVELRLAEGDDINIGRTSALEVWGVFSSGAKYILDRGAATLELVKGDGIVRLDTDSWTVTRIAAGDYEIKVVWYQGLGDDAIQFEAVGPKGAPGSEPSVALESIEIEPPQKMEYLVGEKLDLTGIVVTAKYSDGTTNAITDYSTNPESGAVLNSDGTATVLVSYSEDGISVGGSFTVTVSKSPIIEPIVVSVTPSAYVTKLNGNKNDLTITVTEMLSNGLKNDITKTFSINNNAPRTYQVGSYKVYVDTKGNTQIRECYIVN